MEEPALIFDIFMYNIDYETFELNTGKHNFNRILDDGLLFQRDFFSEDIFNTKEELVAQLHTLRYYLYGKRKLICSTFLLKDGNSLFNLSKGEAAPLLPTISIPVHPSLFKKMTPSDKTKLSDIIKRAHANILFADELGPIQGLDGAKANFGRSYSIQQVVFILDCYTKAVKNCLSYHTDNPNSDDFKLEKEVFGVNYDAYIVKDFKRVSSKFDISNIYSFRDSFSGTGKKDYMAISTKQDVSYQEIYNLFHCKTRFSVLAFLALYKFLYAKKTLQDICPIPCFIPVQYNVPGEKPIVFFAVCICGNVMEPFFKQFENEDIRNNLRMDRKIDILIFMQDVMLKIKDSYLYNKKMQELEEIATSCKLAKDHLRAILHDLVSHVFTLYDKEQYLDQLKIKDLTNYTPLLKSATHDKQQEALSDNSNLSGFSDSELIDLLQKSTVTDQIFSLLNKMYQMDIPSQQRDQLQQNILKITDWIVHFRMKIQLKARLDSFRSKLETYCNDLFYGAPISRSVITIRNLLSTLDQNKLLMNDISGAGSSFKYSLKIFFDNDRESADMSDERFDWPLSIPNDQLGCQAFYMIVNNVIRNAAKHAKRKDTNKEVSVCIRFLKYPKRIPNYFEKPDDDIALWHTMPTLYNSWVECHSQESRKLARNFYTVEIYTNILQNNIGQLVEDQNRLICEPIVDRKTFVGRKGSKGLEEIACAVAYLCGKNVVSTIKANQTDNNTLPPPIDDVFTDNKQLYKPRAFGLASVDLQDSEIKSWIDGCVKRWCSVDNQFGAGQCVCDTENNTHACFFLATDLKKTFPDTIFSGFLGYRFFMLKPEQVLVVRDNKNTITDEKAEEMTKHVGVDVVSAEELRKKLEKGVPVNHDILVCDNNKLIGEYPAMLPARILSVSDIQDFTEPSESETGGESEGHDKSDPFVVHCWEKWVEKLSCDGGINNYSTSFYRNPAIAYFDNHLENGSNPFREATYAEALSSAAQKILPDYEKNAMIRGQKKLANYLRNIKIEKNLAHYRLIESINTRILLLDDRFQRDSQGIPSLGENPPEGKKKLNYQDHWTKCRIELPEFNLSENNKETAVKVLKKIEEAVKGNKYHFIFIHLGLLESVFKYKPEIQEECLIKKGEDLSQYINRISLKSKGRVVVKSGRGVPDNLPESARFVQQTSAEDTLEGERKSKYLFSTLLYNSRSVRKN